MTDGVGFGRFLGDRGVLGRDPARGRSFRAGRRGCLGSASIFSLSPRLRPGLEGKVSTCDDGTGARGVLILYLSVKNSKWYSGSCKSVRAARIRDEMENHLPIVSETNEGLAFNIATHALPDGLTDREADRIQSPMSIGFKGPSSRELPRGSKVRFIVYRCAEGSKHVREDENGSPRLYGINEEIKGEVRLFAVGYVTSSPRVIKRPYRIRFKSWDQPEEMVGGNWVQIPVLRTGPIVEAP